MSRMIRKQVYLDESQQRKLKRLAGHWGCTESEVLREAIERIPESRDPVEARLAEAGLLAPPPSVREPRLTTESIEALERQVDARAAKRSTPLGLAVVVVEDRR